MTNFMCNDSLKIALQKYQLDISSIVNVLLCNDLDILLNSGFSSSIRTGCVYFKGNAQIESDELISNIQDLTGLECFVNDVAIDDYVEDRRELLIQGICFLEKLGVALTAFKGKRFKVILSYDELTCTVRFHQIRKGEIWLDDDIDSYEEGVAFITV